MEIVDEVAAWRAKGVKGSPYLVHEAKEIIYNPDDDKYTVEHMKQWLLSLAQVAQHTTNDSHVIKVEWGSGNNGDLQSYATFADGNK